MTVEDQYIWTENINKLKAFHKKYKNYDVPFRWKEDKGFAQWVENIRTHPNRIPKELLKQLTEIKFTFKVDSDWDTMFSKLETFYKEHGTCYVPPLQYEKIFDWTVNQRHSKSVLTKEQVKKLNSLNFEWEIVTDKDIQWQNRYQELIKFKDKYGHVKVPLDFKENKKLGQWVSTQRAGKTKGELSSARFNKLKALGFLWKEDIEKMLEAAWENKYQELLEYKKKHGHVDRLQVRSYNLNLGIWMNNQIAVKDRLSSRRRKKLQAIGFQFDKGDFREELWNDMYERLKIYKAKHGHCNVKRAEDFKLCFWIRTNRRDRLKLSRQRKDRLEQIGIKWPHEILKQLNEKWNLRYAQLKAFKKEHGHLRVPQSAGTLCRWILTQRMHKKAMTLKPERLAKLMKLGFIWKGEAEKQKMVIWDGYYKKFKALKEKYGSAYHLKLKQNPKLDEWVRRQIGRKDELSALKKKKLDAINFLWTRKGHYWNGRWEVMYNKLVAYKKEYGNCDIPQKYSKDKTLGHWAHAQRGKDLSAYKRDKLNKIGFSWASEQKEKLWLSRFKEFEDMQRRKEKILAGTPLYSWLYQQRKKYHKLPKDKKSMLVKAGFVKG